MPIDPNSFFRIPGSIRNGERLKKKAIDRARGYIYGVENGFVESHVQSCIIVGSASEYRYLRACAESSTRAAVCL
jgi:hypothetical protein